MSGFAAFIMRGRLQAVLVTALSAVLSTVIAPLSVISGAAVGLVTLRLGPLQGATVAGIAMAAAAALFGVVGGALVPAAIFALAVWTPVWLLALTLRRTVALHWAIAVAGLLGAAVILAIHAALADPAAWWQAQIELFVQELSRAGGEPVPAGSLEQLAGLMTGAAGAGLALGATVSLLVARWWQATLYNPGGFQHEFHRLRLGRTVGGVTLVLVAVAAAAPGTLATIATELSMVTVTLFMLQGLAVAHGIAGQRGAHAGWLVALYALLVIAMPQVSLLLAIGGLADNWFDFRAFFARKDA